MSFHNIGTVFYIVDANGEIERGVVEEVLITNENIYHSWNNGNYDSTYDVMILDLEEAIKESNKIIREKFNNTN